MRAKFHDGQHIRFHSSLAEPRGEEQQGRIVGDLHQRQNMPIFYWVRRDDGVYVPPVSEDFIDGLVGDGEGDEV